MATDEFEVTTTLNTRGKLPKVNDKITVDGLPGRVLLIDPFQGFRYRITVPGLIVDGEQQFIDDFVPWSRILDMVKVEPKPTGEVIDL